MARAASPILFVFLLAGCGRVGFQTVPNEGSLDASARVDGSVSRGTDAGVSEGPSDARVPADIDASVYDGGTDAVDARIPLDATACEGDPALIQDFGITLQMRVMDAALADTTAWESWAADSLVFGASSCFDPADPTPLMDALETHLTGMSHFILRTHGARWGRPTTEVARADIHFPGTHAVVRDAADAWGGAPGRYYSESMPTLPCAGCQGSLSISYIVYPETGRIGVLIGGMVR